MARRFSTDLLQYLERELAEHIGPIATVVVARAAERAADRKQLFDALAGELPDADERLAFMRKVNELQP